MLKRVGIAWRKSCRAAPSGGEEGYYCHDSYCSSRLPLHSAGTRRRSLAHLHGSISPRLGGSTAVFTRPATDRPHALEVKDPAGEDGVTRLRREPPAPGPPQPGLLVLAHALVEQLLEPARGVCALQMKPGNGEGGGMRGKGEKKGEGGLFLTCPAVSCADAVDLPCGFESPPHTLCSRRRRAGLYARTLASFSVRRSSRQNLLREGCRLFQPVLTGGLCCIDFIRRRAQRDPPKHRICSPAPLFLS